MATVPAVAEMHGDEEQSKEYEEPILREPVHERLQLMRRSARDADPKERRDYLSAHGRAAAVSSGVTCIHVRSLT